MERYIGLDVHAVSCTVAVIPQAGRRLKDFPVKINGQALVEAVRRIPGEKHLVFGEDLQSAWLYETVRRQVLSDSWKVLLRRDVRHGVVTSGLIGSRRPACPSHPQSFDLHDLPDPTE